MYENRQRRQSLIEQCSGSDDDEEDQGECHTEGKFTKLPFQV